MERLAMRIPSGRRRRASGAMLLGLMMAAATGVSQGKSETENAKGDKVPPGTVFRTSDRCVACHNGLTTKEGEDISIGFEWRASIMANSSRDPYWQGSVRRESIHHPGAKQAVADEGAGWPMAAVRRGGREAGRARGRVFRGCPCTVPQ